MIRVSILYPNEEGKKFDWDYYLNKHMPMLHEKLDPISLIKAEIDKGIGSKGENTPAPFCVGCHLFFNSMEDFQKILPYEEDMFSDVPNYTDIIPLVQISEMV